MSKNDKRSYIRLKGVRQNNLKGIDVEIPLEKLTVVTGLSGSGKSSLVFETLHAEGQRRYVETFSAYARQFLETLDRPKLDSIENIRPSIAIEQTNTVKTSRSTVGTMTELCDYFKVWFGHVCELFDPATGKKIEDDNPQTIWEKAFKAWAGETVFVCFEIKKPKNFEWDEILESLKNQGFTRFIFGKEVVKLDSIKEKHLAGKKALTVIQDRIKLTSKARARFIESANSAMHFGGAMLKIFDEKAVKELGHFSAGLHSPETGRRFKKMTPADFSFNSPIGACSKCRGFGRIIEIDYNLVIPDKSLSINQGAIKAFSGEIFGESLNDLKKHADRLNIRLNVPWKNLTEKEIHLIIHGEKAFQEDSSSWMKAWYGIKGFFEWLESKTYKMHIRFLLSKYRSYRKCDICGGSRLKPEALLWKWLGYTLPDLYAMSLKDLFKTIKKQSTKKAGHHRPLDLVTESILTRLSYLNYVGLGYLTLDRTSRTLSGGEVERVNLTTCLGTSLVDTLFVLDEPSVGLHSRDISKLVTILRNLTDSGNTVVVVEHDEGIIAAADHLIELGPKQGIDGGQVIYSGPLKGIVNNKESITGRYLTGNDNIHLPIRRRSKKRKKQKDRVTFKAVTKNNIKNLDLSLPLKQFVCITGVSGSGKSTLLKNVIFGGLEQLQGRESEDAACIESVESNININEAVLVDQSPLSRTPRSNTALYIDAWDSIRELFAKGLMGRAEEMRPSHFSFNSGQGRCGHCMGLGYEKVEMQFLSDVFVTCPVCEGKRFRPEVLAIKWNHKSIADILEMNILEAMDFFKHFPKVTKPFKALESVGLGYLTLGQPLNTLSGGESQRLKLVKYLNQLDEGEKHTVLLLDEPTTGLHRDDIKRLINVFQKIVHKGISLVVIEHQMDVIKCADWIIEMGPEAGIEGGKIVAQGQPEQIAAAKVASSVYLDRSLQNTPSLPTTTKRTYSKTKQSLAKKRLEGLELKGAREHNLKNVNITIPHNQLTVLTGVSGSGKSSLAFDIIFAEGQRRFMESISPYARQFVEQLPKPNIDRLTGIPPTVAIEQRVTRGTHKSTVATITEVAQYLRLLYARVGTQHNPKTHQPVIALGFDTILKHLLESLEQYEQLNHVYLSTPLIRSRKGHHQPLANWAQTQGYKQLKVDGQIISLEQFKPLDRYKEHDIELILKDLKKTTNIKLIREDLKQALELGKGSCLLIDGKGKTLKWFSTKRTDPTTGEAFPELDPKNFSWNSPRGWCPACHGHGYYQKWMQSYEDFPKELKNTPEGAICSLCEGTRLNAQSRFVFLITKDKEKHAFPALLQRTPKEVIRILSHLELDKRGEAIIKELLPEIKDRLAFLEHVGLDYLSLDRSTNTLSGGEAQRIRLAGQLSSTLSGVLYVLDEPSIGLHARDSKKLIESLQQLKNNSNTLLVVEHDEDTIKAADYIIDLGPGAGVHGGEVLAQGSLKKITSSKNSLTARYLKTAIDHPLRNTYRKLPSMQKKNEWLSLKKPALRNLKKNDLFMPLGKLIVVCGISGAGKSTLIRDLLKPSVEYAIKAKKTCVKGKELLEKQVIPSLVSSLNASSPLDELVNGNVFKKVIEVDQEPIGKTIRSTPATYIGAFDIIRDYFGALPESKIYGFTKSHYSFNTPEGRCEKCSGAGRIKVEMNFLPNTFVTCDACNGSRYGSELQEIRWNNKNISEILNLSFEEAQTFFSFHHRLKSLMELMVETGLGYLNLGQASSTLSGGEAQRLKLVTELAKGLPTFKEKTRNIKSNNLYLLEEPTIGLHLKDCERLIHILHRLVEQGHTVIVIEHHLDIIAEADYIVEVGPEGGEKGGEILYQGPIKKIFNCKQSITAPFLKDKINF